MSVDTYLFLQIKLKHLCMVFSCNLRDSVVALAVLCEVTYHTKYIAGTVKVALLVTNLVGRSLKINCLVHLQLNYVWLEKNRYREDQPRCLNIFSLRSFLRKDNVRQ